MTIDISNGLKKCMSDAEITNALAKCVNNGTLQADTLATWLNYGVIDMEALEKAKFITPAQQQANKLKHQSEQNKRGLAEGHIQPSAGAERASVEEREKNNAHMMSRNEKPAWHGYMAARAKDKSKQSPHGFDESKVKANADSQAAWKKAGVAHAALAGHFDGTKKLSEIELKGHQKTLNDHYVKHN